MIETESIGKYLDDLASGAPTPGGGAAAALTLAQAAALISMVCNFTLGREKYKNVEDQVFQILDHAKGVQCLSITTVNTDIAAYEQVRAAYALPKSSPQELAARTVAIQVALENAATVPWQLAKYCEALYDKAVELRPICNQNLVSDVDVAICLIRAAVNALWVNIDVNLKSITNKNIEPNIKATILGAMQRLNKVVPEPVKALLG